MPQSRLPRDPQSTPEQKRRLWRPMNLRCIDLNLLVVFDALIATRSITRAARKVGVSQSAMSHALRRLRQTFDDEILRRTPRGMVPTQRALQLLEPIRLSLFGIERAIDQQLTFDPKTSQRIFNLQVSDYMMGCLVPRICARVRAEAPKLSMVIHHPPADHGQLPDEAMDIELMAGASAAQRLPGRKHERLLRDRFLIAMRRGHPALSRPITREVFLGLPHLIVSNSVIGSTVLEETLHKLGWSGQPALRLPSVSGVIPIIRHSDLCAVLPGAWLKLYAPSQSISVRALPFPDIDFIVEQRWHARNDRDPGLRWLRQLIRAEFEALHTPSGGRLQ